MKVLLDVVRGRANGLGEAVVLPNNGLMTEPISQRIRRLLLADTPSLSLPERVRATLGALLAVVASAVAVALSVWLMRRLNCIHSPDGALAMLLVHEQHWHMGPVDHTVALSPAS